MVPLALAVSERRLRRRLLLRRLSNGRSSCNALLCASFASFGYLDSTLARVLFARF